MGLNIEVITQIVPKNNANLAVADVNDLKGGYIQVETLTELDYFKLHYSNRLKIGMLAYVTNDNDFYQLWEEGWKVWQPKSGATLELSKVKSIDELTNSTYEVVGNVVFVTDLNALRWYDGNTWNSFSRIYIQSQAPDDTNGIWVDTDEKGISKPESVTTSLLKMINVLAKRVSALEYREQQLQSGGFDNNMYNLYDEIIGVDPGEDINGVVDEEDAEGTTELTEYDEKTLLENTLLADSSEPITYKDTLPNVKHLQIKWGTYADMVKYKDCFLPAELLYCYNTRELWIKDPKTYQLIKIGATTVSGDVDSEIEDIMNGIIQDGDYISSIAFVDMVDNSKHYTFSVQNGELDLLCEEEVVNPVTSTQLASFTSTDGTLYYSTPYNPAGSDNTASGGNAMLWIHAVYTAGNPDNTYTEETSSINANYKDLGTLGYSDYNPCNYSFIELVNTNPVDINLNGFFLHYTEKTSLGWISLPLKGIIKAKSTYLIRASRTGKDDFARIKVGTPDIYFHKGITYNNSIFESSANKHSIWDEDGLLLINNYCSFLLTGPCYSSTDSTMSDLAYTKNQLDKSVFTCSSPWYESNSIAGVIYGYCDLVGFGSSMPAVLNGAASPLVSNRLAMQYYSMDNVSQAFKNSTLNSSSGWKSSKTWTTVELLTNNAAIDVPKYTPKNSKSGKNIFYNKHLIEDGVPVIVTCSFGYNPHTTRCFAWVSKGYRDEYLQYKKEGDSDWITVESFKSGDGRTSDKNWNDSCYDRIRSVTTDGTYFTAHKVIIDLYDWKGDGPETSETYVYRVGYNNNWTDEKKFTLRNRQDIIKNGFSFVQTTDLQGFNQEEYEEWKVVADHINDYYRGKSGEPFIEFMINTGDATLNGNRINEWIDYFNAGASITDIMEQQYTVGNNDLCPTVPYELGLGSDTTKVNPINVEYFFTYEHPFEVPKSNGVHLPSVYSFIYGNTYFLSMNSEFTDSNNACEDLYGLSSYYVQNNCMKIWADNDMAQLPDSINWKIAYCHEAPFTLLINSTITNYDGETPASDRGSVTSHFNSPGNWWFSKFLEDNGFNLCICGHKHTYTTSHYLHDNEEDRMKPYVYKTYSTDTLITDTIQKKLVNITDDTTKHYVKYTMCLASGYKLTSNKELPGPSIGWLECYYPASVSGTSVSVNTGQRYPHYIVWNIGEGTEIEGLADQETPESRERILGKAYKIRRGLDNNNLMFNYNDRVFTYKDVTRLGGNGETENGNLNIIVEKLPYTGE